MFDKKVETRFEIIEARLDALEGKTGTHVAEAEAHDEATDDRLDKLEAKRKK